jgi:DNA-binding transcriptional LysR family regulator
MTPRSQKPARRTGRAFSPGQAVQPSAGGRVFTISLSDYSMTVFGRPLLRRVQDLAPEAGIRLRFVTWEETEEDRSPPGYDLLVRPPQLVPDDQPEVLWRDRIVYVGDPANPRLSDGRLTAGDLAALPHAAVRLPGPACDAAATALLHRGIRPNVVLATPGWLELPFLVAGTDMVAAVPERLARRLAAGAGVIVAEPPFGPVELAEAAWWHPLHVTDPGLTCLRGLVAEVAASLATVPGLSGQRQPGNVT